MLEAPQLVAFFAAGKHADGCFSLTHCNRLVNVCILKTCDWIVMSMFDFRKSVTFFGFPRFLQFYFFACVTTDRSLHTEKNFAEFRFR